METISHILSRRLRLLCQSFDKDARNWRKSSKEFCEVASVLSKEEWIMHKQDIEVSIFRRLKKRFTIAEIQQYPAHNLTQYAKNAIQNIGNRINHPEQYKRKKNSHFIELYGLI